LSEGQAVVPRGHEPGQHFACHVIGCGLLQVNPQHVWQRRGRQAQPTERGEQRSPRRADSAALGTDTSSLFRRRTL